MFSVIGQPVLLVVPHELNITSPVTMINIDKISFFIFERFNWGKFAMQN